MAKRRSQDGKPVPTTRKRKSTATLNKIAERALNATPDQVRTYIPVELDWSIAEAMMAGGHSFQAIAEIIPGTSATTVSAAMRDAVRCAWISHAVHQMAIQRIGLIDAAMLQRAVAGDTKAAQLMYKRLDLMTDKKMVAHVHGHVSDFDPTRLSDEDLDRVLEAEFKEIPKDGKPTNTGGGASKDQKPPREDRAYPQERYE